MRRQRQKWGVITYAGNQDEPTKLDGWYEFEGWAHERACRYWEAQGDDPPTTTPSSLAKIEAALGRNGVAVFRDPTCVRPASTRAALNCRPETILVVGCLMDAYSTVTYWAACLYQIRGYLAVLNGPA